MLFSSMVFLWLFLPIVFLGSKLITKVTHKSNRNHILNIFYLVCSLLFYSWGGISYLLIILGSILVNYLGGFLVAPRRQSHAACKRNLILIIAINLLTLGIFKYCNMGVIVVESILAEGFFKGLWDAFLHLEGTGALGLPTIALPIGISFFTFQAMSYCIDVYRGDAKPQESLFDFALYVSFFPQLVAGPIVKYSDIETQLQTRKRSRAMVLEGQRRFVYGLAKKVIIADTFGAMVDQIWQLDISKLGGPLAWLGMIAYTIQIYYDFSGYSDMAIGIGKMLGFRFRENFDLPYTSLSVREFWRRWHMSLSSWFRDYVYIPLGGSREGMARTCLNTLIVFLLTGIWHGANFTFLFWGLAYAILLIAERLFLGRLLDRNPVKFLNWLYTMLVVMVLWVFFRSDNIAQGFTFIGQLFTGISSTYSVFSYLSMESILLFVAAILLSGWLQKLLAPYYSKWKTYIPFQYGEFAFQILLIILCILKMVSGSYSAFIYFQF